MTILSNRIDLDPVLLLREARTARGLTQKDLANLSGVGEKTISSFETGERIGSLKLHQLKRLLAAMRITEQQFFSGDVYPDGRTAMFRSANARDVIAAGTVDRLQDWFLQAQSRGLTRAEIAEMWSDVFAVNSGHRARRVS